MRLKTTGRVASESVTVVECRWELNYLPQGLREGVTSGLIGVRLGSDTKKNFFINKNFNFFYVLSNTDLAGLNQLRFTLNFRTVGGIFKLKNLHN